MNNELSGVTPTPPEKIEIDPKEIVHYYVDGGVKGSITASAFVRKAFKQKPKEESRKRYTKTSSTKSEIRAIRLAMEDAFSAGFDPAKVVIHTDQKHLVFNRQKDKKWVFSKLQEELDQHGFKLAYIPSTHSIDMSANPDKLPKKVLNALQVHNLVTDTLSSGHNRYRYHLMKKRQRRSKNKKKV